MHLCMNFHQQTQKKKLPGTNGLRICVNLQFKKHSFITKNVLQDKASLWKACFFVYSQLYMFVYVSLVYKVNGEKK